MLKRITRLKIALFIICVLLTLLVIYTWSSESSHPLFGNPRELNRSLLEQEVENAKLILIVDSLQKENERMESQLGEVKGIYFEVLAEIAFDVDDELYMRNMQDLHYKDHKGRSYFSLGKFRDLEEAERFRGDLENMGIESIEILSVMDGKVLSK